MRFFFDEICRLLRSAAFQPPGWVGGHKWYRIEMPMVHRDVEAHMALFQFCDQRFAPLLGDENEKSRFLGNDPILRTFSCTFF